MVLHKIVGYNQKSCIVQAYQIICLCIHYDNKMKGNLWIDVALVVLIIMAALCFGIMVEALSDEELNDSALKAQRSMKRLARNSISQTQHYSSEREFTCYFTDCNWIDYSIMGAGTSKLCGRCNSVDNPIKGCGFLSPDMIVEIIGTCKRRYGCLCSYVNYERISIPSLHFYNKRLEQ